MDFDETKWWPANVFHEWSRPPMRAAEACYGVLGPSITLHLLQTLAEAMRAGVTIPEDVQEFMSELEAAVGRPPDMLVLMGIGAGLALESMTGEPSEDADVLRNEAGSVAKLLGSLVVEAMERFGFNESSFRDYVREGWHFSSGNWPPRNVPYHQIPPR